MKNCSAPFRSHKPMPIVLRPVLLVVVLWGSLVFSPAFAGAGNSIDHIVAIAGNEAIMRSQIDRIIRSRKDVGEGSGKAVGDGLILRNLIEEHLLKQEATRRGISVSEAELENALLDIEMQNKIPDRATFKRAVTQEFMTWDEYTGNLEKQIRTMKLLRRAVDPTVRLSDESIKVYYHRHPEIFGLPDRIELKQLLLEFPEDATESQIARIVEKAENIREEAVSGTNFEQLVRKYSDGKERAQGGDLGVFKRGDLSAMIEDLVFDVEEGGLSEPLRTPLGVHIFKVESKEEGRFQDFEKVAEKIRVRLTREQTEEARATWLSELWDRAYVEIK